MATTANRSQAAAVLEKGGPLQDRRAGFKLQEIADAAEVSVG